MNTLTVTAIALSATIGLSGCVGNSANDDVSYDAYTPGYTGYTVGQGAYGIPNGYGPAFWGPGYYNYTGYDAGYIRGHRTAYYGGGGYRR